MPFTKAVKYQHKIRLGLSGPTGAGKTYTALKIACAIAAKEGGRVAVIDSEHGTASLYADEFDFDHMDLQSFAPDRYVEAIHEAENAGYAAIVVDSATQAWAGKDGALEQVDKKASQGGNSFTAWRDVTPQHNRLVEAMVGCKTHIIVTVRSKMAYALQEVEDRGRKRTVVEKLGLQPVQREGMEYEFDVFADLDVGNVLTISKTRCKSLQGYAVLKAGDEIANILYTWAQGAEAPPPPVVHEAAQETAVRASNGAGTGTPASTSPAPSPPFDQLGTFKRPDGGLNALAFGAELRRRELSPKDLHGIVEPNETGDGADIKRWLREHPTLTLIRLAEMAQCNRYGHEEPVFTEDPDAGMICPRCKLEMVDTGEAFDPKAQHDAEAEAAGEPVQQGLAV